MSLANLKRMKKELLLINKKNNTNKLIIQALDGLFIVDFKADIDSKERIKAIKEAPEDVKVNVVGANIDDIIICGGIGEPVIIIDDIDYIDAPDINVLSIVPSIKDI
jgi:hypothetical protein